MPFTSLKPHSRILLIEPPFYRFFGYERWHYPVTLTLVGTYLERLGHHVRIYDADKPTADCRPLGRLEVIDNYPRYEAALDIEDHPIWCEAADTITAFNPDVICLTAITAKIDSADRLARMARQLLGKKVTIILGGPHVQGMLLMDPGYDFGPHYDRIVPRIPDLIRLRPNRNLLLEHGGYSAANLSGIMTSTGCPNSCTFCCHSFEKTMVYRDRDNVRAELEEIRELFRGEAPVYVMDDCFFSNGAHFDAVSTILHELGLSFSAGSRIMALSPEKIERFAARGGTRILVGVESGSQRVLDRVEKRLKIEEVERRTRWLHDAGIPWSAFFVVGFPFETVDDLKLTEELIHRIRPTFASINRFTPYPGTRIYQEHFADKPLPFRNLFQLNRKNCVPLADEVAEYIDRMFATFDAYNRANGTRPS